MYRKKAMGLKQIMVEHQIFFLVCMETFYDRLMMYYDLWCQKLH